MWIRERFLDLTDWVIRKLSLAYYDDEENLRRCEACALTIVTQRTLDRHLGHRLVPVRYLTIMELVCLKKGWL